MSIIPVYVEPVFPTIDPSEIYEDDDEDQWTKRLLNQSMLERQATVKNAVCLPWKTWRCIIENSNLGAVKTQPPI